MASAYERLYAAAFSGRTLAAAAHLLLAHYTVAVVLAALGTQRLRRQ